MEPETEIHSCHFEASDFVFKPKTDACYGFVFVSDILYALRSWQRTDLEKAFMKGHESIPCT